MIHIYAPQPDSKRLVSGICPDCGRHTWFIEFYTAWIGRDSTCIRCGRVWCDGEWTPLDFVRGSRQRSVDSAKRRWRMMVVNDDVQVGVCLTPPSPAAFLLATQFVTYDKSILIRCFGGLTIPKRLGIIVAY